MQRVQVIRDHFGLSVRCAQPLFVPHAACGLLRLRPETASAMRRALNASSSERRKYRRPFIRKTVGKPGGGILDPAPQRSAPYAEAGRGRIGDRDQRFIFRA